MVHEDFGFMDAREISEVITVGNGTTIRATKVGNISVRAIQRDGTEHLLTLTNVKLAPKLRPYNLLSIPAVLSGGFQLGNVSQSLMIRKGNWKMIFDWHLKT